MTSKDRLKKVRSSGLRKNNKYVQLICSVCGAPWSIRTNYPDLYTEDITNKWRCLKCGI